MSVDAINEDAEPAAAVGSVPEEEEEQEDEGPVSEINFHAQKVLHYHLHRAHSDGLIMSTTFLN